MSKGLMKKVRILQRFIEKEMDAYKDEEHERRASGDVEAAERCNGRVRGMLQVQSKMDDLELWKYEQIKEKSNENI